MTQNNPYTGGGVPFENWQRGYDGLRFIGVEGSDAHKFYQEGKRARTGRDEESVAVIKQRRIFIDLDGPTVDFDRYMRETGLSAEEIKRAPGSYLNMKPTAGAIEAIRMLISWGYEVWIATKPPTGNAQAYADKAQWVINYLPELTRRIILTHDKGLLGDEYDYLIDDRPHKANCQAFKGALLHYRQAYGWPEMLWYLKPPAASIVTFDPANAADDRTVLHKGYATREEVDLAFGRSTIIRCDPQWTAIPETDND